MRCGKDFRGDFGDCVINVVFRGCRVGREVNWLGEMVGLRDISLRGCTWIDDIMREIGKVAIHLECLDLSYSSVKDEQLAYLNKLSQLHRLDLSGCDSVTGKHLDKLRNMRVLMMRECRGLRVKYIGNLVWLEELNLGCSLKRTKENDVSFIGNMIELRKIDLSYNGWLKGFHRWDRLGKLDTVILRYCSWGEKDFSFLVDLKVRNMNCYGSLLVKGI